MDDEFEELLAKMEAQQRRAEEMQREIQTMEITGKSRNGEVTATLKGGGQFTAVKIDPRVIQRYGPDSVGMLVVEAVNDGLRRAAEASMARFEPLIAEARAAVPDLNEWR
ncbi:MAG TPA: YbaB/EbfC family nucleoid-associated protein [Candidatus Limnocylindrales bacterium]|nr:YbaB/EbfC family nucleoid-associated protein [Candidatus Limnocylindrales bacterium]